jgi:hypothetical protein
MCRLRGIEYDEQAVRYLLQEHYIKTQRKLRANHPRDLLDQMADVAQYLGQKPQLTKELIDRASDAYFVEL